MALDGVDEDSLAAQLQESIENDADLALLDSERQWLAAEPNRGVYRRYLRARERHLPKSRRMLIETLHWRRTFKPQDITAAQVGSSEKTGKMQVLGTDAAGHPIILMKTGLDPSDSETKIKHFVWFLETVIQNHMTQPSTAGDLSSASPPQQQQQQQQQWIFVIDFLKQENATKFQFGDISVGKQIVSILSNHYPERLFKGYYLSPSAAFFGFWKIVSWFLAKATIEKMVFLRGERSDAVRQMVNLVGIDQAHLPAEYRDQLSSPLPVSASASSEPS